MTKDDLIVILHMIGLASMVVLGVWITVRVIG